ncbi:MAG TPA: hypothetical protein PKH65_01830 [Bacteroidia bacterium]|nr:hypothetical protein [Bacteroidia bacterium]HNT79395.1 hypothetical protein [Bacteroidia bacterium]
MMKRKFIILLLILLPSAMVLGQDAKPTKAQKKAAQKKEVQKEKQQASEKELGKRHLSLQDKKVKRRMKKSKRRSKRQNNIHTDKNFFQRLFIKRR